jgi:hypothetical protein
MNAKSRRKISGSPKGCHGSEERRMQTKKTFTATDADLPAIFDKPEQGGINPVASAKLRVHNEAQSLGLEVSSSELLKFAVILIALEQR